MKANENLYRKSESNSISDKTMYREIYKYLEDKGLDNSSEDKLIGILKEDEELRMISQDSAINSLRKLQKYSFPKNEFRCGIEHLSLMKRWNTDADTAIKKLVSMSTTSFIHCGQIVKHIGEYSTDDYGPSWESKGLESFLSFLVRYKKLIQSNIIIPIPSYRYFNTYNSGDFGHPEDIEETDYEKIDKGLLNIDLDLDDIKKQFFETRNSNLDTPIGSVELYLPHLENIDFKTIVKLRKTEEEAFIKYHRHLSDLLNNPSNVKNERTILDCLRKVDEGVRETESSFKAIRANNLYKGLGLGVGLACTSLLLFLDKEIAEYIQAVLGGATGVGGFNYLASRRSSRENARKSDFFFPWLLAQKS